MMSTRPRIVLACSLLLIAAGARLPAASFIRGDVDSSGEIDITDPVMALRHMFAGTPETLGCPDAADVDDSETLELTDAILVLEFLFLGGTPPRAPFPDCGADPAGDDLGCAAFEPCAAFGSPPRILGTSLSSPVQRGEELTVEFDYDDPDGDIAIATVRIRGALREDASELPASLLGIEGTSGRGRLVVATGALAYGEADLWLLLRDELENESEEVEVTIEVVGDSAPGVAPTLAGFAPVTPVQDRPARDLDSVISAFTISFADAGEDIEWARLRIERPDGSSDEREVPAAALGVAGAGGEIERRLLPFDALSPLGTYTLELTLFDRGGRSSPTLAASMDLVESGGAPVVSISGFAPESGPAGTEVVIEGSGLDPARADELSVEIGDVPLDVLDVTETSVTVRIGEGVSTGAFVLRTRIAQAISPTMFRVPPAVTVRPEEAEVQVEATLRLDARVVSAAPDVTWSVAGVAGGDAEVGMITPEGLYTAPADVPGSGSVTITAALTEDDSVVAASSVTILPPPSIRGAAVILPGSGGVVRAERGLASVRIPAGALDERTEVTATSLLPFELPTSPDGARVLGGAEFGPPGLEFSAPVTIAVPLIIHLPPGTELPLYHLADGSDELTEEGIAVVSEDGERAIASVSHFSGYFPIQWQSSPPPLDPPTVDSMTPGRPLEEGRKVPVLLEGSGLTPDLTAEVIDRGTREPSTWVLAGPWYGLGNRGGVLIDIGPLFETGVGEREYFDLRLTRPDGVFTEVFFGIDGLDELRPGLDQELTMEGEHLYSVIWIGHGTTIRASGLLELNATGEVEIAGTITGAGEPGNDALVRRRGEANSTGGGRGGHGRKDNGCFIDISCDYDGAGRENFGQHGNDCIGDPADSPYQDQTCRDLGGGSRTVPAGMGGIAGANFDVSIASARIATDVGLCVEGVTANCIAAGAEVKETIEFGGDILDLAHGNVPGRRGFGAVPVPESGGPVSAGGGGGGGGGRLTGPAIPIPVIGGLVSPTLRLQGGGGGGGGGGAQPVRIHSGRTISFVGSGRVTTEGGRGGHGSQRGVLRLDTLGGLIKFFEVSPVPAAPGGGGGGGRGEALVLRSAEQLVIPTPDAASSAGGRGGDGGATIVDPQNGNWGTRYVANSASDGPPGYYYARGPYITPETLSSMVTDRTILRVETSPGSGSTERRLIIVGPDGVMREETVTPPWESILLARGFSWVWEYGDSEFLKRRILVLATDRDGDGLGDEDEVDLGSDPDNPDTDGDGILDGHEIILDTSPLFGDSDLDGLPDGDEISLGCLPTEPDSDEDGFGDGLEVVLETDPVSNQSVPTDIPDGTFLVQSGPWLLVLDRDTGRTGVVTNLGLLLPFGLDFDESGNLLTAEWDHLDVTAPFSGDAAETRGTLRLASSGTPVSVVQIAYHSGDDALYGVELGSGADPSGQLLRIDPATAEAERIGAELSDPIHGLVVGRGGELFATIADDATSDEMVELDRTTGAIARSLGRIGEVGVFGMVLVEDGKLLATARDPDSTDRSRLVLLDPSGAAATSTFERHTFGRSLYALTRRGGGGADPHCSGTPLTLAATVAVSVGGWPDRVVTGNLDGTGGADVAVADPGAAQVVLLSGFNGSGFDSSVSVEAFSISVALDRLYGDATDDLASVPGELECILLRRSSTGTKAHPEVWDCLGDPLCVVSGDFDGNGLRDLAALSWDDEEEEGHVVTLLGDGAGGLALGGRESDISYPLNVAAGDFNEDGRDDLVVSQWDLLVSLCDASGAPVSGDTISMPGGADRLETADVNGDGHVDIVTNGLEMRGLFWVEGKGDGSFEDAVQIPTPPGFHPSAFALGDLDDDGAIDIVTTSHYHGNEAILLYFGDGSGGFTAADPATYHAGGSPNWIALGDVDDDGDLDVVTTVGETASLVVHLNTCQ